MTGHIFIEGSIGDEVTAKSVREDIATYPQAKEFIVHINSGGGDVYEGYQIVSILKNLGKPKTAYIGAMCASIATPIAESCDKVVMSPQGDFMIHLPTAGAEGTAEDHRKVAVQLDRIKSELINLYMPRVSKKGVTESQLSAMIDRETSMSPSEALAMGFIDEIADKLRAVAKIDIKKFEMEKTVTKEEMEGAFAAFGKKMDVLFSNIKKQFKNAVQIALADGTMATSGAETPDALVNAPIAGPDGKPLADGQYETADGYTITVVGGTVTAYEPLMDDKNKAPNAELEALKKENADLKAQIEAKANEVKESVQAQAKLQTEFKNAFSQIKKEMDELKSKTFGDPNPATTDPNFKAETKYTNDGEIDPMLLGMQEMAHSFVSSRQTNIKLN